MGHIGNENHGTQKNLAPIGTIEDVNNCSQTPANESQARPGDDWYEERICEVIDDLNEAGIEVMSVPLEARRKARELEREFTEAANADDMPRFWRALREWQRTWKGSLH
jgi:hypothetical protein